MTKVDKVNLRERRQEMNKKEKRPCCLPMPDYLVVDRDFITDLDPGSGGIMEGSLDTAEIVACHPDSIYACKGTVSEGRVGLKPKQQIVMDGASLPFPGTDFQLIRLEQVRAILV